MTDKFIINTNAKEAKSLITEIVAIRKLIENRDVGDIVAQSVYDFVRATPHTVRLTVMYFSKKYPPYGSRGIKGATYNIPDLIRANASWPIIKTAMGGTNGFMWGRFRATANLDNGRQCSVYAGSESGAATRLKALVKLSSAKIITLTVTEEKKEGLRATDKILYKPTIRMYPAYFSILSSKKIINESNKEISLPFGNKNDNLSGTFRRKKTVKIPLYLEKEPAYVKPFINEMLRDRGTDISS